MIRSLLRKILPFSIKLHFRLMKVRLKDTWSGNRKKMALPLLENTIGQFVIEIKQPLRLSASNQEKKQNLLIAIEHIHLRTLTAGSIFSFWHCIGNPTAKKGYRKSRAIQDGKIIQETGGGLCQLSGMLYYLALLSGMQIIERHAHSLDIYTEAERFTPLGSDATVVYGYKDLRFCNNSPNPIQICFEIKDDYIIGRIHSQFSIEKLLVRFEQEKKEKGIWVTTIVENKTLPTSITPNFYRTL